jgi:hypothetical protein
VNQPNDMDSAEARIIHTRLDGMVDSMYRLANSVERMQEALHAVIELRAQQATVLAQMSDGAKRMQEHDERLKHIERELPGLREIRRWVIGGVLAGVTMMGTALMKLVIIDQPLKYYPSAPIVQPPVGKP